MPKVDLVMWAHRPHQIQELLHSSVMALTSGDFAYHEMIHPGTCHENQNRAYHTGTARYVCLLDEDVQIVTPEWIWYLLDVMEQDPKVGVVNCSEVKTLEERERWVQIAGRGLMNARVQEISWAPAFVTLYDRTRTPWLEFDEEIPGRKGMSDKDASLQLRAHGLKCVRHTGVAVYHPHKGDENERLAMDTTTKQEELACYRDQVLYMMRKWEQSWTDLVEEELIEIEAQKMEKPYHKPSWYPG